MAGGRQTLGHLTTNPLFRTHTHTSFYSYMPEPIVLLILTISIFGSTNTHNLTNRWIDRIVAWLRILLLLLLSQTRRINRNYLFCVSFFLFSQRRSFKMLRTIQLGNSYLLTYLRLLTLYCNIKQFITKLITHFHSLIVNLSNAFFFCSFNLNSISIAAIISVWSNRWAPIIVDSMCAVRMHTIPKIG